MEAPHWVRPMTLQRSPGPASRQCESARLGSDCGRRGGPIREIDSMTKTLALAALILSIAGAPTLAYAQDSCATQATDKKLAGAAKTSFMK